MERRSGYNYMRLAPRRDSGCSYPKELNRISLWDILDPHWRSSYGLYFPVIWRGIKGRRRHAFSHPDAQGVRQSVAGPA